MIITWIYTIVQVRSLKPDSVDKWTESVAKSQQVHEHAVRPYQKTFSILYIDANNLYDW